MGARALGHISKDLLRKCYLLLGSELQGDNMSDLNQSNRRRI